MPYATTALFDFINALLVVFRADPTLTALNTKIEDGPPVKDLSHRGPILWVAGDATDPEGSTPTGSYQQEWGELGARAKYENVSVTCQIWSRAGETDMAARRAEISSVIGAMEQLLRTNLNVSIPRILWAQVSSGEMRPIQTKQGAALAITLLITARAHLRITS